MRLLELRYATVILLVNYCRRKHYKTKDDVILFNSLISVLEGTEDTSLTLVKVNADEAVDVVKHFGIRSLPTFIFHKDGNAVSTFVGSSTKSDFLKKINENFQ
jgi:thioredoxin-like negative regulator of GroEL